MRVDRIVALHLAGDGLVLPGVGLGQGAALLLEVGQGEDEAVVAGVAVEDHHLAQGRELVPDLHQLGRLAVVLGEGEARLAVAEDVGALLGGVRGVDGGGGAAGTERRHVGEDPLEARGREDAHPVLALQAQGVETAGDVLDPLPRLAPGHAPPGVATGGELVGEDRRGALDPREEEGGDRLEALAHEDLLSAEKRRPGAPRTGGLYHRSTGSASTPAGAGPR